MVSEHDLRFGILRHSVSAALHYYCVAEVRLELTFSRHMKPAGTPLPYSAILNGSTPCEGLSTPSYHFMCQVGFRCVLATATHRETDEIRTREGLSPDRSTTCCL